MVLLSPKWGYPYKLPNPETLNICRPPTRSHSCETPLRRRIGFVFQLQFQIEGFFRMVLWDDMRLLKKS